MPEAPPESPGHVGHTPQHADVIWRRSRLAGLLTTNVARLEAALGQRYASQEFRQLQRFGSSSSIEALARAYDYGRRVQAGGVDPQPLSFLAGLTDPRLTRTPRIADAPLPRRSP
jgi:hypothetical protein